MGLAPRSPAGPTLLRRAATTVVVVVLVGTSACSRTAPVAQVALPDGQGRATPAEVVKVVDGDTVDLDFGDGREERVRLLGVDTPETVKPDTPVQCFGPEASARTKELLAPGTAVLVQRDEEARDRYGRLLAYVWRRADGLFVNRTLVADGYARTLSIAPNDAHRADLSAAAAEATAAGVGLWGSCPADGEPEDPGP